jgi:flavin reductase (DIM6/NTAB) family NADH-FMN oxidoreductase RutF
MKTFTADDLESMEKLARVQLITSLPGAKPISLIGTTDGEGRTNLAPFSSVVHLGSNPPLLGMVSRPDLVERHTLANLMETGAWTINHLHEGILDAAHQCSARYDKEASEFAATFVAESRFRMGLELEDLVDIAANGTRLIIGRVVLVQLDGEVAADGSVDLPGLGCLASTALDTYFSLRPLARLAYAKPDREPRRI